MLTRFVLGGDHDLVTWSMYGTKGRRTGRRSMDKLTLTELCAEIVECVTDFSAPAKGPLVFVKAERQESLRDLAILLAEALSKDKPVPIYVIQGGLLGEE